MSEIKIIGNPNPEVGNEIIYKLDISNLPASLSPMQSSMNANPFIEQVKWSIYILEYGEWILKEKNNKTGPTANYTFTEKSLKRDGIRIIARLGEEKTILNIKPQKSIERKIIKVELCDALGNLQTKPFSYNQTILARVHCLNLNNCTVHVTLWEDDSPGSGHSKVNKCKNIITKSDLVSNGIAELKFILTPDFARIADTQLANGDQSKEKMHEYYVTAEIFRQETKSSNNINVNNPSNTEPKTKSPSKKEEKGIPKTINGTIYDYSEQIVAVNPIISFDPQQEFVNKMLMVNVGDSVWNQKKVMQNGDCYCNRDLSYKVLIDIGISNAKALEFIESINKTFADYEINTCLRKSHFLAQVIHESGAFRYTYELGVSNTAYNGFKGRGLIQLTGESNYNKYGEYENQDFTSTLENKIKLEKLPYSVRSSGWFGPSKLV